MININFKSHYQAIHFTNELGTYKHGGTGTYMNEFYHSRGDKVGFIHFYNSRLEDIAVDQYPGRHDILALSYEESGKIREFSYDIAVVHYYGMQFLLADELLMDKPLIYVVHCIPTTEPYNLNDPFGNPEIQADFKRMCLRADAIVCVSESSRQKLLSIYPDVREKTYLIYNGLTIETQTLPNRPISNSRKKFGYIGRLEYRKGLMECVKQLKRIDGELYVACGSEDMFYLNCILDYIEGAGIQDRVHFLGWCEGARKMSLLHNVDALIIPSLYESFGYVLIEAMYYQVPIISTRFGGISELLGDYKYQFDSYDPDGLYQCIQDFQQENTDDLSRQLHDLYQRKNLFTTDKMIQNYQSLFQSLLHI